ncbi:hypothetical protein P8452_19321 [Trifolium repens]|nr:hypothetical protein P8452_19321 [Trifolium repens]
MQSGAWCVERRVLLILVCELYQKVFLWEISLQLQFVLLCLIHTIYKILVCVFLIKISIYLFSHFQVISSFINKS